MGKVALIINGGDANSQRVEKAFEENVDLSLEVLKHEGFETFVLSPNEPEAEHDHYYDASIDSANRMIMDAKGKLGPTTELFVYVTGHGNELGKTLSIICFLGDCGMSHGLFDGLSEYSQRTIRMDQCLSGNYARWLVDEPRTLFSSKGDFGQNTAISWDAIMWLGTFPVLPYRTDSTVYFWADSSEVPDINNDGAISWSERHKYSSEKGSNSQGERPILFSTFGYAEQGVAPFSDTAQRVTEKSELEFMLKNLKSDQQAVIGILDEANDNAAFVLDFEALAKEDKGSRLWLLADRRDVSAVCKNGICNKDVGSTAEAVVVKGLKDPKDTAYYKSVKKLDELPFRVSGYNLWDSEILATYGEAAKYDKEIFKTRSESIERLLGKKFDGTTPEELAEEALLAENHATKHFKIDGSHKDYARRAETYAAAIIDPDFGMSYESKKMLTYQEDRRVHIAIISGKYSFSAKKIALDILVKRNEPFLRDAIEAALKSDDTETGRYAATFVGHVWKDYINDLLKLALSSSDGDIRKNASLAALQSQSQMTGDELMAIYDMVIDAIWPHLEAKDAWSLARTDAIAMKIFDDPRIGKEIKKALIRFGYDFALINGMGSGETELQVEVLAHIPKGSFVASRYLGERLLMTGLRSNDLEVVLAAADAVYFPDVDIMKKLVELEMFEPAAKLLAKFEGYSESCPEYHTPPANQIVSLSNYAKEGKKEMMCMQLQTALAWTNFSDYRDEIWHFDSFVESLANNIGQKEFDKLFAAIKRNAENTEGQLFSGLKKSRHYREAIAQSR